MRISNQDKSDKLSQARANLEQSKKRLESIQAVVDSSKLVTTPVDLTIQQPMDLLETNLFNSKNMRILVINNLYPPQELGGYGRSISSFAGILQERGHTIQVLSSNASYLGEIITPESNIRRELILRGDYNGGMNVLEDDQENLRINNHNKEIITDTIKNFKPDVCLVGNIQLLGTAIFEPFFQNNIPIIHHLGFAFLQYDPLEKPTSRFYHLSAASEYVKHSILKTYNFDDVSVIYPGAFVQKFYEQRNSNHFDKIRIVFAGIVINTKGVHTLLEALKILDSYFHVDFECSIAGDINYDKNFVETLHSFVAANELMSKVKFLGYQSQEQLIELFSRHNVLVFPSIAEEAFGISQVEAMAAGLLVITTGVGGAGEVVEDGVSGLKFPPENAEVLARQLYALLSEPEQWELMANNGQQRALRFFNINLSVDLLEKKFYELLYPSATKPILQDQNPLGLSFNNDAQVTENTFSNKILWGNFQDFTYSKKSHLKLFRQFGFYLGVSPEKYDPIFDLKFYQDLLVYNFIIDNFSPGAKLLEVGGGNSRVIKALKHDYECWNVDKLDGVRTGPTRVDEIDGYYLVRSYMGDFCSQLPDAYFDCVFSISALEHTPEDEDTFKNVLEDIDRVLAPDGISLHCFDVRIMKGDVWTNKLLPYLFKNVRSLNQMIPFSEVQEDTDLYGMSETSYKRWWQSTTQQNYEVFGQTISYNILWQKQSLSHPSQNQSVIHPQINRVELMVHNAFPKISVVTPSYNQSEFLEECIDSVLGQGYPNLEYVIMDGGSTDDSINIIKKYEKHLTYWQSQPDGGQYMGICEGFKKTTGEVMAWLNSDDKYHPDAFFKVATVFNRYPQVEWLMGRPTEWNRSGILNCVVSDVPKWSREYILSKKWLSDNLWIQQESTFWKRSLWEKAGEKVGKDLKLAGDFELWLRFSRYAQLFFVDTFLAGFRSYESNRSKLLWDKYMQEIEQAINEELTLIQRGLYTNSLPAPQTIFLNDEEFVAIKQKAEYSVNPIDINQKVKVNQEFLSKQKEVWNVDSLHEAMFSRVFTSEEIDKLTLAEKIAAWDHSAKVSVEQMLENIPTQPNWKVLEIGCGVGRLVKPMRELFAQVDGVDISDNMIQFGHQYLADGKQNGQLYVNNGSDLKELPSDYYDFVYSTIVFQHIRSISVVKSYFAEVFRVLKPNGYFKIQVHDASSPHFGRFDEEASADIQYGFAGNGYTIEQLRQLLTEHHFNVVSLKSSDSWLFATAQRPAPKIVSNSSSHTSLVKTHFKVSAIVSTYNSEEFIRGCLQDLVDQSLYKKGYLEIIVIDSASQQNEQLIIREFQSKYPNIIYERTLERETLYASWNRAIKIARGDYITNANTDDRHRSDALEVMASYLDVHPEVSLVYADQLITHVANDRWATTQATETWNWPVYSYSELQKRCIIGPQPLWRKSLHKKYGYFRSEFKAAGDYEFWLRIGKTEKLVRLPEVLGLYYFNPQGLSTSGELGKDETDRIWNEYRDLDQKPILTPKLSPPLVSVIIPTKDRPKMLSQAIQSVLDQTFTELEIIVVNDGGVDVQSVISRLNTRGNIIYKKHDRALERSAARNTGIRAARGKYIAYLDDDDNYYPNHIETLVKFLENSEYKIAYTDSVMAQQEKQNGEYVTVHRSVPYSLDFDNDRILVSNCTPNLCLMHEKSCLDEVGLFDETLSTHEDWDLIIRLSRKFDIAHIKETTCEFTQRNDGTNTSSHNRADFTRTREIIFNKYRQHAEANPTILEAQKEAFIAEVKELAQQFQQIQAEFTQSLDKLHSQLEEKESHLQQTQAEKSQLAAQVETWQRTTQEVQAKLDASQSEKEWVKSQLNSWKQTAEEMQMELDRSRLKLKQAQLELERSALNLIK
jgi:glycosyltransferase involved in cell wall biosynthesis/ubiquinone/menaquinone biosynthesis C-methylase UbiE